MRKDEIQDRITCSRIIDPYENQGEFKMEAKIVKKDVKREFLIEERCFIIDSSEPSDRVMSIAIARVEPGVTTAYHYLDGIDERYLMMSGKGSVEVGDMQPRVVRSGDIVYIPAGTKQRIANTGSDDLVFYCVCTPPFDSRRYHHIDEKDI
jgi:mannose-6-phosphate isomerase-like protein (cupin superfamily)